MIEQIFDVKEWGPAKRDETIARLLKKHDKNTRTDGLKISTWENDGSLSPLKLYCYLKTRFGEPNGFMMLLKPLQ